MRVARATARNADLVVSNHALTLADPDSDVLPLCSRIIFDEAHNLEAVATDQLGREVSTFSFAGLRRTFGAEGRRKGLVDALAEELDYFLTCIANGVPATRITPDDSMAAVVACLAAEKSAATGQVVRVADMT